jgi:hypothetical protein
VPLLLPATQLSAAKLTRPKGAMMTLLSVELDFADALLVGILA